MVARTQERISRIFPRASVGAQGGLESRLLGDGIGAASWALRFEIDWYSRRGMSRESSIERG